MVILIVISRPLLLSLWLWLFVDSVLDILVDSCLKRADHLAFRLWCFTLCCAICLCSFPAWCIETNVKLVVSVPDHWLFIVCDYMYILSVQNWKHRFPQCYNPCWTLWVHGGLCWWNAPWNTSSELHWTNLQKVNIDPLYTLIIYYVFL